MCVDYTNLVPKGSISFAAHRSSSRLDLRVRSPLFPRRLLEVSPDHDEGVKSTRDFLRHAFRLVLLHCDAFRLEERWRNLPTVHDQMFWRPNRVDRRGLRR